MGGGGVGSTHPLHPSPRSAPFNGVFTNLICCYSVKYCFTSRIVVIILTEKAHQSLWTKIILSRWLVPRPRFSARPIRFLDHLGNTQRRAKKMPYRELITLSGGVRLSPYVTTNFTKKWTRTIIWTKCKIRKLCLCSLQGDQEIHNHVYRKRRTSICNMWPRFRFTYRLLFILTSCQLMHENSLVQFLFVQFLIWKIVNVNLPFVVNKWF